MKIDETYNIHKKINCIFPFFKSKLLCKKGLHSYQISNQGWICACCGRREKIDD